MGARAELSTGVRANPSWAGSHHPLRTTDNGPNGLRAHHMQWPPGLTHGQWPPGLNTCNGLRA
jgi:hypothetical protein